MRLKHTASMWVILAWVFWVGVAQAKEFVSIGRHEVNLRSGAGIEHEPLWILSKGYPLAVIRHQGNWLKVRDFENDTGWVSRKLVSKTPYVIVKASSANIRSAPNTRSRVLAQAKYGDVLRHLERRQGWVKVEQNDGLKGWIARKLLWGW